MSFLIRNNILLRYTGSETNVVIPDGITEIQWSAFENCRTVTSVHIPRSVQKIGTGAFSGCHSLFSLAIPDSVTKLDGMMFSGCSSLTSVTFPKKLTAIGMSMFSHCTSLTTLTIPGSVTKIGASAFTGCTGLEHINIPDGVTDICDHAFTGCTSLKEIVLPNSIRWIGPAAFSGCTQLRRVVLPHTNFNFTASVFENCPSLTSEIGGDFTLRTDEKLSTELASANPAASDEDRAYVLIHQTTKAWLSWAARTVQAAPIVLECCASMLTAEAKVPPAVSKQISAFMLERESTLKPEAIVKMLNLLKEKKCKVDPEQFRSIAFLLSGEKKTDLHPIEGFTQDALKTRPLTTDIIQAVKGGTKVHYASGDGIASLDVLRLLIYESADEWNRRKYLRSGEMTNVEMLSDSNSVIFSETAERIADALNRAELAAFLGTLTKQFSKYRPFMLAHARFADEAEAQSIISQIGKNAKGKAQQRFWAENMTTALMHNDTRAAMLYFDKLDRLEEYARMRGMSALELRDSRMMPEFAFDTDGVKRYDIGGNTIEVTIESDLSFRLFDVKKGKVVKSIPKKSDKPEKAAACAEDFKAFKKNVLDFYKLRTRYMHDLHLGGDALSSEIWHSIYLTHPVLKYLTRLLVWQDENKKSFMPLENSIIDAQGMPYTPQGKITLAHVMSMSSLEVSAWQKYLTDHSLVQPFGQMWEPVVQFNADSPDLSERYKGVVLSKEERSTLKKSLAAWGIDMRSDAMEREFNARAWSYEYSNASTFSFDGCVRLDYEVDPDAGTTTLDEIEYCSKKVKDSCRLNAIFLHLDRAAIRAHIMRGADQAVATALTADFTLAQINEFIDLSTQYGQTSCTALLLSYKNEHFSDFGEVDEFSLDW